MFRSLFASRCTVVAFALILAFVLSTVPAQAQPRDFGSSFTTLDGSWLEAALSWFDSLLGGGDTESVQGLETSGILGSGSGTGGSGDKSVMGGSCIDPYGGCGM